MDINMPELRGAAQELGIDLEDLLPAIEDAILGAYTKVPGAIRGAHVEIDRRSGHMAVLAPEVDEEDQPTGEFFDDTPDDFGRIAQATARSVIVQRIQDRRDFEVLGAFKDKAGEVSGDVEIMAVAREAGHRTKMAVRSRQRGLGAKGACIGPMGQRVRAVMAELGGEKIDIVDYSDEPARFIANALSPARVSSVHIQSMEDQTAKAVVPDFQLSLAIGKEGQNARLAARLTGWKIDIHADAETGEVIAGRGSRADDVTGPSAAQRDA